MTLGGRLVRASYAGARDGIRFRISNTLDCLEQGCLENLLVQAVLDAGIRDGMEHTDRTSDAEHSVI
jgi:hypothetical protein